MRYLLCAVRLPFFRFFFSSSVLSLLFFFTREPFSVLTARIKANKIPKLVSESEWSCVCLCVVSV